MKSGMPRTRLSTCSTKPGTMVQNTGFEIHGRQDQGHEVLQTLIAEHTKALKNVAALAAVDTDLGEQARSIGGAPQAAGRTGSHTLGDLPRRNPRADKICCLSD